MLKLSLDYNYCYGSCDYIIFYKGDHTFTIKSEMVMKFETK
jgi:hypothetical protein